MLKEYRLPVSLTYGMSETASMVTATSPGDLNSAGRVLKHRDIRIEDGRIVVGGATLFSGHFFEGKYSPHKENEFRTSDLGKISDGELTVIGRADNIFISGGENISPKEIEKEVLALSGIFEAYLIPTPDEIFGTTGTLFYKGDLKNFEITTHLKSRVHPYKMPKRVAKLGDHKNLKTKYQDLQKDAVALSKIKRAFLIHGFMGAPSDFYFLQEELAELQIEIINIELPKKNEFTDSESYLNSILQTVPKDGLTLLFGYSMGGRVALQLLKKAPELFFKVAVISPHPGHYEEVERAQRRERDSHLFDQINDHKSFTQFLFDWYSAPMWGDILDDELFANSLLNKRYNADFKASLDILTLGNQPPLWDFLKETGKDILYISGELDKKYCEIGETLSKENSSIRHVVISEAGHNVHKKKKGDLVALLTHFIFN